MSDTPKYGHGYTFHVHLRDLIDGASGVLRELLSGAKLSDESYAAVRECRDMLEVVAMVHRSESPTRAKWVATQAIDRAFAELTRIREEIVAESPDIQRELQCR